jgi:hypothetical protein
MQKYLVPSALDPRHSPAADPMHRKPMDIAPNCTETLLTSDGTYVTIMLKMTDGTYGTTVLLR